MQCRQVLLEIRRKRDEELKQYQELCTKIGPHPSLEEMQVIANEHHLQPYISPPYNHTESIKKRRAILTLE
ncbi:MAG TPA: hypothetical protein VGO47_03755, partial [Chlamydiales bacterium]|nr:hypothetical protein [Chlamydiales bacterium]